MPCGAGFGAALAGALAAGAGLPAGVDVVLATGAGTGFLAAVDGLTGAGIGLLLAVCFATGAGTGLVLGRGVDILIVSQASNVSVVWYVFNLFDKVIWDVGAVVGSISEGSKYKLSIRDTRAPQVCPTKSDLIIVWLGLDVAETLRQSFVCQRLELLQGHLSAISEPESHLQTL